MTPIARRWCNQNVFWTLLTPLVNIVGLYSNVPEGGEIRSPQTDWLVNELKTLPTNLPLLVALHHPVYSADSSLWQHADEERVGKRDRAGG